MNWRVLQNGRKWSVVKDDGTIRCTVDSWIFADSICRDLNIEDSLLASHREKNFIPKPSKPRKVRAGKPKPQVMKRPRGSYAEKRVPIACIAPDGTCYDSLSAAGRAYSMSHEAIRNRCDRNADGWRYADEVV